jgi:tRNA(fMet)-specific endonuclease VapC
VIFDTGALSNLVEGNALITPLLDRTIPRVPVVVLGEFWFGLHNSRMQQPLLAALEQMLSDFQVLSVDVVTARHYADIREELRKSGRSIPENDLWIAALSRQHNLSVVSKDAHFDVVDGLRRLTW